MKEIIINAYKHIPYVFQNTLIHIKKNWKWLVIPFVAYLLVLIAVHVFFTYRDTTEIVRATFYYRLVGMNVFLFGWLAIWRSLKHFKRYYFVTKLYNIMPVWNTIVLATLYMLMSVLLNGIISIIKPINIDTSVLGVLYYVVLSIAFITIIVTMLGYLSIIYRHVQLGFYIVSAMMLFTVPIFYIIPYGASLIRHILMLNPIFYLVVGTQDAMIIGPVKVYDIPYHFYFYFVIAALILATYCLSRFITYQKVRVKMHEQHQSVENDEDKAEEELDDDAKTATSKKSDVKA